jgi:hypothetical protein
MDTRYPESELEPLGPFEVLISVILQQGRENVRRVDLLIGYIASLL